MKDDISVFWRCNKRIFVHVAMFSVGVWTVLFLFNISIPTVLIVGVVLMWFVAVTTAKHRQGTAQGNNSHLPDVELEIWQDLEPTWATNAVAVISVLIFWTIFFGALFVKYKFFPPLELFTQ